MCRNNLSGRSLYSLRQRSGPRVGIDIDGVLRNIDDTLYNLITKIFPEAKQTNPEKWKLSDKYDIMPKGTEYRLFEDYSELIFGQSPAYPGAVEFISDLRKVIKKYKAHLAFVTKQTDSGGINTLKWISRHNLIAESIFFIRPNESKTLAECDILLDDNYNNLCEQEKTYGGAICFKQPWNIEWTDSKYDNYNEILKVIETKLEKLVQNELKH